MTTAELCALIAEIQAGMEAQARDLAALKHELFGAVGRIEATVESHSEAIVRLLKLEEGVEPSYHEDERWTEEELR